MNLKKRTERRALTYIGAHPAPLNRTQRKLHETLLGGVVAHRHQDEGLHRGTASEILAMASNCPACEAHRKPRSVFAEVPRLMADGLVSAALERVVSQLGGQRSIPSTTRLWSLGGSAQNHCSLEQFVDGLAIADEDYEQAVQLGIAKLIWDDGETPYPQWTLEIVFMIFANAYPEDCPRSWRKFLADHQPACVVDANAYRHPVLNGRANGGGL